MSRDLSDNLSGFLLQEQPNKILKKLRQSDSYPGELSKETGGTYSHVVRVIQAFEDKGLVEKRKVGRKKVVSLTEDGERLADAAFEYFETLEEIQRSDSVIQGSG